jgi:DNA polymerase elongation subunit (family B)
MFYTNVFRKGNNILARFVDDSGRSVKKRLKYSPYLFIETDDKETEYKSIYGKNLKKVEFRTIYSMKEYLDECKLAGYPVYGNANAKTQFISHVFPGKVEFDISKLKILSIDIETTTVHGPIDAVAAKEEITHITVKNFNTKITTSFYTPNVDVSKFKTKLVKCDNEKQLLLFFTKFIEREYPDIITGYRCNYFDIPYICNRILRLNDDNQNEVNRLSPWGIVSTKEIISFGEEVLIWKIEGIALLDYYDLYRKFSFKSLENFKLDTVVKEELGREKLKHPYKNFREFYEKDPTLFLEYNIVDVDLVDSLEDKMQLIKLALTMTYEAKCNYDEVFSAVALWDSIITNYLEDRNIAVSNAEKIPDHEIVGAYVKEPVPGLYDWVVSFDATSLYPSIIMSLNMSPETLVEDQKLFNDNTQNIDKMLCGELNFEDFLKEHNYSMASNGQCFRNDKKGIFPEIIESYFNKRQVAKKEMLKCQKQYEVHGSSHEKNNDVSLSYKISSLDNVQMAIKILMNSLYGVMAESHFRWFDTRVSEGITMTGQTIIRNTDQAINKYLQNKFKSKYDYVTYCDTDSVYIHLGEFVKKSYKDKDNFQITKILDKICNKFISPTIDEACKNLSERYNFFTPKIVFKREVIASKVLFMKKKKYAMNIYNSEGVEYNPPKIKVKGLEIVRSSTPAIVKVFLKDVIRIMLTSDNEELIKHVEKVKSEWRTHSIYEISKPSGVKGINKYIDEDENIIFKNRTPIHVRGSLVHNLYLRKFNVDQDFDTIKSGDKIKYTYLKLPNKLKSNIIAFKDDEIPKEFDIETSIDYDLMLEKTFLNTVERFVECVGWKFQLETNLEELFGEF